MKLLFLLLLLSIALSSCISDKCEGVPTAYEASISVLFLNANGTQSLFSPPTTYNQDSVRVSDEQGKAVTVATPAMTPGRISFRLFERGQLPALGQPVTRRFLLYLKHTDQDTIVVDCELYKPECANPDLKRVVVYYNNRKVHEGSSGYIPELVIRKP